MKIQSETEIFAQAVRTTASDIGMIIVDGFPIDGTAAVRVSLESSEILRLFSALKPRVMYLHEEWFDYDSQIADLTENLAHTASENFDISPLSALKKSFKRHDGKLCLVWVAAVIESVLHVCFEEAEWYESFQSTTEEVTLRLKEVLSENRKNADVQNVAERKRLAEILVNDAAFNFNRPSAEKRRFLAKQLFPDCGDNEIHWIVEEATSINWLRTSSQNPEF